MVDIPEDQQLGLNPKDFLDKELHFVIALNEEKNDAITELKKLDKNEKEYSQYILHLGGNEEFAGERRINFLFARDLKHLREEFGADSKAWVTKKILVSGKKEGEWYRWVLQPELTATTETIEEKAVPAP